MATLKAAIKTALTGNASWAALVTGGTAWRDEWGRNGLEPETAVYDTNGKLKLSAVLTFSTETEAEIAGSSARGFFQLWVYHDSDTSLLTQAHDLARSILNNTRITADNHGTPLIRWVSTQDEFKADELSGAMGRYARYRYQMLY